MTLRRRSWVIGRGVAMFSICSAMALASKIPTQIGRTFCPSLSRRMMIGMFVIGSTMSPLIVISICIGPPSAVKVDVSTSAPRLSPDAVRSRTLDAHGPSARSTRPDPAG